MTARWQLVGIGLIALVALAGLWAVVRNASLLGLFEDSQHVVTWVRGRGPWRPLAIVALEIGQVLLAPIPGQAVGVAAGYLYGTLWGTLYCLLGMAAGSWMAFRLARVYGRPLVERLVPHQTLTWLDAGAQGRGLFFFALVFLLPFLPDDLACFVAGLTAIPIPALMLVAITARAPGILVSSWVGANAEGLNAAQRVILIAGSAFLAGLALLYGEQLQQWLMARLAGKGRGARSRPPSLGV
jgi:uncharacterized membrane protein YdjX (TVP38/TMEM64 family)